MSSGFSGHDLLQDARALQRPYGLATAWDPDGTLACAGMLAGFELVSAQYDEWGALAANQALLGSAWAPHCRRGAPDGVHDYEDWIPHGAAVLAARVVTEADAFALVGYAAHRWRPVPAVFVLWLTADHGVVHLRQVVRELNAALSVGTARPFRPTLLTYDDRALGGALDQVGRVAVFSQMPFGVWRPDQPWIPDLRDAIGDLAGLDMSWEPQTLVRVPSWWSLPLRAPDHRTDGHMPVASEIPEHLKGFCTNWSDVGPGVDAHACWPFLWHPDENRLLTHREYARLCAFPDAWSLLPLQGRRHDRCDGLTVGSARWILRLVLHALGGRPGPLVATETTRGLALVDLLDYRENARRA
jgi:hypothetical protein